jgi:hypothetical protein
MKKRVLFSLGLCLLSSTSYADSWGFTAPAVSGDTNVSNPGVGDIVYDLTSGGFFGYNQSGSWVNLGPGVNNSTLATLSNFTGVAVHGTNTNDNAATGYDGEFISINPASSVTPGATTVYVNVASVTLSAGDWDVEGVVNLATGSTWVGTKWGAQISTTTAGSDSQANGGVNWNTGTIAASGTYFIPTGTRRLSLGGTTTTIYLTAQLTYSTLGSTTFGTNSFLRARRVR